MLRGATPRLSVRSTRSWPGRQPGRAEASFCPQVSKPCCPSSVLRDAGPGRQSSSPTRKPNQRCQEPQRRDSGGAASGALAQSSGPWIGAKDTSPPPPWPQAGSLEYLVADTQGVVAVRHHLPVQKADERVLRAGDGRRRRRVQYLQARHVRPRLLRAEEGRETVP